MKTLRVATAFQYTIEYHKQEKKVLEKFAAEITREEINMYLEKIKNGKGTKPGGKFIWFSSLAILDSF